MRAGGQDSLLTIIFRWILSVAGRSVDTMMLFCLFVCSTLKRSIRRMFVGGILMDACVRFFFFFFCLLLFFSESLRFSLWCDTSAKARRPTFKSVLSGLRPPLTVNCLGILFLLVCTAVHSSFFPFRSGRPRLRKKKPRVNLDTESYKSNEWVRAC